MITQLKEGKRISCRSAALWCQGWKEQCSKVQGPFRCYNPRFLHMCQTEWLKPCQQGSVKTLLRSWWCIFISLQQIRHGSSCTFFISKQMRQINTNIIHKVNTVTYSLKGSYCPKICCFPPWSSVGVVFTPTVQYNVWYKCWPRVSLSTCKVTLGLCLLSPYWPLLVLAEFAHAVQKSKGNEFST